ncbi:hypothetical protein [Kribbella sp. NPDC051718]|uniref:hypothetical protein n=1 Tax=Kribbella sp. NPDC051718 TaxID=3155168 RepID=UPI00341AB4CD
MSKKLPTVVATAAAVLGLALLTSGSGAGVQSAGEPDHPQCGQQQLCWGEH